MSETKDNSGLKWTWEEGNGKKGKAKGTWRPKEGHPYVVARHVYGHKPAYEATRTGDEPELLATIEVEGGDEKDARDRAEEACEQHAAEAELTWELTWELTDGAWTTPEGYRVVREDTGDASGVVFTALDPEGGFLQTIDVAAGTEADSDEAALWLAQELCETHRLEQGRAEAALAAVPGKPERERGTWTIPMPLSAAEKANAKDEFDELWAKRRRLLGEIAASEERHKALKKRKAEQIGELDDELDELQRRMPERDVECYRSYYKGDLGNWWVRYTALDDEDWQERDPLISQGLYERRLEPYEQRQLFGEDKPPADKPPDPASDDEEKPEEPPSECPDQAGLPEARARMEEKKELLAEVPRLQWGKVPKEPVWTSKGDTGFRIDLHTKPGEAMVTHFGAEVHWCSRVPLERAAIEVKGLKKWCQSYLDSRLRWLGDPDSGVQVDSTGRYQIAARPKGELQAWDAQRLGGLDEDNVRLREHDTLDTLEKAKAACQAHADGGGS
jgi:hypothetical protein